jgi:hypothetical protein
MSDKPNRLTPAIGEQWLLRADSVARITGVTKRLIHGTVTTKHGGMGMTWLRNGMTVFWPNETAYDLIERVPQ